MFKLNLKLIRFISCLVLVVAFLTAVGQRKAFAQLKEPSVRAVDDPVTHYEKGFRNRLGVSFLLNNFGFGINAVYGRGVAPFTELTFTTTITAVSNASAQEFIYYFTGRKVVPNRFKRAFGFSFLVGIERRLFPYVIADNFRFFISADVGPSIAFTYPYFTDENNNGYRDTFRRCRITPRRTLCNLGFEERINGFFGGWSEGDWHFGLAGDVSLGVDLGNDIGSGQVTLEIGYFFYYYPGGLQIMEPFQRKGYYLFQERGNIKIFRDKGHLPFYEEQSYFGTPHIKFTYSWWL